MDNIDPIKILQDQFERKQTLLDQQIGQQEQEIDRTWQQQYGNLEQQYNIERKYLEQSPGEMEQKKKALLSLNKKYEMKLNDLRTKIQPHVEQLKSQRATAEAKLGEQLTQAQMELNVIDRLAEQGVISDPRAIMQQKLQAVGIDIPYAQMRQPKPEDKVRKIESELSRINNALKRFEPGRDEPGWKNVIGAFALGKWGEDVPLGYKDRDPVTGEEVSYDATEEQIGTFKALLDKRQELERQRNQLLLTGQPGAELVHHMGGALNRVAQNRNPLAVQIEGLKKQTSKSKGKLTDPAIAQQFLQRAQGDPNKARALAQQAGWEL